MKNKKIHSGKILGFMWKTLWTFLVITLTIALYDMYTHIEIEEFDVNDESVIAKEEEDISNIIENASESVVGISKLQSVDLSFFSLDAVKNYNLGTGIIASKKGYIVSNYHVTGNVYSKCYVTTKEGKEYTAETVWVDKDLDLSILKLNTMREVETAQLGDSDNIKVGEEVYAIGNPLGRNLQRTVTFGIISALDRNVKISSDEKAAYMEEMIQTDASINSGNSGGPLINTKGEVIGITAVKEEDAEGIGFAIPINIIKPILQKFEEEGQFSEASLGAFVYDKEAIQFLDSTIEFDTGIYVSELIPKGSAKQAGIKEGDIITKIDETEIKKINDFRRYIYTKKPGDKVKLKIIRGKQEIELYATLNQK